MLRYADAADLPTDCQVQVPEGEGIYDTVGRIRSPPQFALAGCQDGMAWVQAAGEPGAVSISRERRLFSPVFRDRRTR